MKIDIMHKCFGYYKGHKCKECSNLIKRKYDKTYYKCKCYGESSSTATDWKINNEACGLFNKEYNGIKGIKLKRDNKPINPIKGQITMF